VGPNTIFFVARAKDGTPKFMQASDDFEGLRKSAIQRLDSRRDVDRITMHMASPDDASFKLITTLVRNEATGFYQCGFCTELQHERNRCHRCQKIICSEHLRPYPDQHFTWLCIERYEPVIGKPCTVKWRG